MLIQVEIAENWRESLGTIRRQMAATTLDAAIRRRLLAEVEAGLNQSKLAKAVGRSPGWVNKYIYGAGNATIDDIVSMARFFKMSLLEFVGLPPGSEFTAEERDVIDRWRRLSPRGRDHVRGLLREMQQPAEDDGRPFRAHSVEGRGRRPR